MTSAVSVAAAALLLLAGCTTAGTPPTLRTTPPPTPRTADPAPGVCAPGRAVFGTAAIGSLLTGVTPVLDATTRGMTLDQPYTPVGTRTAAVQAGAEVPAERVYQQLAETYVLTRPLVGYGTRYDLGPPEPTTFDGLGRFVEYEWIRTVDVPFTYACGGRTSDGTVISWEEVGRSGALNCDQPDATAPADLAGILRQVRRLRCAGG